MLKKTLLILLLTLSISVQSFAAAKIVDKTPVIDTAAVDSYTTKVTTPPVTAHKPSISASIGPAANYTKDMTTGCKVFNPAPESGESVSWSGACTDGYASGSGVLQWYSNGQATDLYNGEINNGKRHGTGTFRWKDGSSYEGGWANHKYDGNGIYTDEHGTVDNATFVSGKYNGKGFRTKKDGTIFSFIAVNNKFVKTQNFVNANGCFIADMKADTKTGLLGGDNFGWRAADYNLTAMPTYTWDGNCINGFADGTGILTINGTVKYKYSDSFLDFEQKQTVDANNGNIYGNVSYSVTNKRQYGNQLHNLDWYRGSRSFYNYYFYGNILSKSEYDAVNSKTQNDIQDFSSATNAPSQALNDAINNESVDAARSENIYRLIMELHPNTKEERRARYRLDYLQAYNSTRYDIDLGNFISTYSKNDPDKLVPKAKDRLAAEAAHEARREAERNSSYRTSSSGGWKLSYTNKTSSGSAYAIACNAGRAEFVMKNDSNPGWFNVPTTSSHSFQAFRSLDEAANYACN